MTDTNTETSVDDCLELGKGMADLPSQKIMDALYAMEDRWTCYWKIRCLLAEDYIADSPCDPDIYPEQIVAYAKWQDFKNND